MTRKAIVNFIPAISAGAWTPASLPNLVAWYSADSGVYSDLGVTTANNGDPAEQWNDKSGHGYHAIQTSFGNRPIFGTSSFNSLSGVSFANTSVTGMFATGVSLGTTSTLSVFVVANHSSLSGFHRLMGFTASGDTDDFSSVTSASCILGRPTLGLIGGYRNGASLANYSFTPGTDYRFGAIFDSSVYTFYLNNVAQASPPASTGTFGSTGTLNIGINRLGDVASGWDGSIAEIVVTADAVGSTDRTSLDDYFKTHWGL